MNVDDPDLAILRTVQGRFPLVRRPYRELGRELGLSEDDVHRRVSALRRSGVIRRLGPLFSSRTLGLTGRLVAARCAPDAVDRLARLLDGHDEITHNYLRTGPLNVWCTLVLPEGDDPERILAEVRGCPGVDAVHAFRTVKIFKLDASFPVGDNDDG